MSPGTPVYWTKAKTALGPIRVAARYMGKTRGGRALIACHERGERNVKSVPIATLSDRSPEVV